MVVVGRMLRWSFGRGFTGKRACLIAPFVEDGSEERGSMAVCFPRLTMTLSFAQR